MALLSTAIAATRPCASARRISDRRACMTGKAEQVQQKQRRTGLAAVPAATNHSAAAADAMPPQYIWHTMEKGAALCERMRLKRLRHRRHRFLHWDAQVSTHGPARPHNSGVTQSRICSVSAQSTEAYVAVCDCAALRPVLVCVCKTDRPDSQGDDCASNVTRSAHQEDIVLRPTLLRAAGGRPGVFVELGALE